MNDLQPGRIPHVESMQHLGEIIDVPDLQSEPEARNLNEQQLPRTLIGHDVVMAMMMPDREGLLPRRHIVVLRARNKLPQYQFSTHYVAWQPGWNGPDGSWVLAYGHYDMIRTRAIRDMIKREHFER